MTNNSEEGYNKEVIGKLPINMTYACHTVAVQLPPSLQRITLHKTVATKRQLDSSCMPICFHKGLQNIIIRLK